MALSPAIGAVDGAAVQRAPHRITTQTRDLTLKASIVSTSVSVDMAVKEQPLHLLYQAAIDRLNETLEPELGPEAIQSTAASGMDFSPEAVAERIVGFATGFFSAYMENHPDEADSERLGNFMSLIRGAIDQGFTEARDILDGLGVLQGDVKANVDSTYELIQQKLDSFEQRMGADKDEAEV